MAPPGDDAKFLNHSDDPNTHERRLSSIAARPIFAGDEITCDYGAFCVDWPGLAPSDDSQTGTRKLPHEGLYARLQPSDQGVGVFAIRDIPKGTALFESDEGATPRVDVALVDELADDEPRRMYYDFCPVVGGAFVTPAHFDQLTMGWCTPRASRRCGAT